MGFVQDCKSTGSFCTLYGAWFRKRPALYRFIGHCLVRDRKILTEGLERGAFRCQFDLPILEPTRPEQVDLIRKANCGKFVSSQVIYLFSESLNDDVLLVVELLTVEGDLEHTLGWSFCRLLKLVDAGSTEEEDSDSGYAEMSILRGSPRSLFLMESFENVGGLPSIGPDAKLLVKIKQCPQHQHCSMYLPENTLLTAAHCLPGITPKTGLTAGQCDPEIETEVDRIKISIQGTKLSALEKELSRSIQLRSTQAKTEVTVVDWFLKVFVHNGWRTVEPVQSVLLEVDRESASGKTSRGARTAQLAAATILSASNKVLLELPRSENVAVVFILQCVLAEVNENGSTAVSFLRGA
ncbi:unnamed protein product [Dibothriocephalus latus]|uniref:Peptidase S1 domain-containing protein n=1 Tax=Dibothriocephalus latus TaxID=60516 RepID=A0A3P7LMU3_DIBLA|nr:unnamed protein product [Dibothriocephalus latus]